MEEIIEDITVNKTVIEIEDVQAYHGYSVLRHFVIKNKW